MVDQPKGPYLDTTDIDHKFSADPRGDYPNCDGCGRKIGSEEDDAKDVNDRDFVVRIFKDQDGVKVELDLCKDCVKKRMRS